MLTSSFQMGCNDLYFYRQCLDFQLESSCSISSITLNIFSPFHFSYYGEDVEVSHCALMSNSLISNNNESTCMYLSHLCIFFYEMSDQIRLIFFLLLICRSSSCNLWTALGQIFVVQIFSLTLWLVSMVFLEEKKL